MLGVDTASDVLRRNPITGIVDCWPYAMSGQAIAAPLASVMNSRRLMCAPPQPSIAPYHTVLGKTALASQQIRRAMSQSGRRKAAADATSA
jgi:hypothetical protein